MAISPALFETIQCPICSGTGSDIVRPSAYPAGLTVAEVGKLYSASSSHILMDQVVRCHSCSLVYVNPRLNTDLIIQSYSQAEDSTFVAQNEARIKTFDRMIGRVLKAINKDSGVGMRLLDVGCAGGAFLVAARSAGFDVSGVEPSRWMADFGRRTYGLDIQDGVLNTGMFSTGTFDVITLWDVIEHVPNPHQLLVLIHSLLKPEGWLVVNYPDIGTVAAKLLGKRWPFWLSVHLLYYTRTTMKEQLTRAGFQPKMFETFWQTLQLGYVLRRASAYVGAAGICHRLVEAVRLGGIPCTYNMGQTLTISRKDSGPL
jgi:SAM-dependent methyltransferase